MFAVLAGRLAFAVFDVLVVVLEAVDVLPFAAVLVVVVVVVVVVDELVFAAFVVVVTLVFARLAFALVAVLVLAASPQAIPRALRPRTAERTTFFISEISPVFSKVKLA